VAATLEPGKESSTVQQEQEAIAEQRFPVTRIRFPQVAESARWLLSTIALGVAIVLLVVVVVNALL
jgi:hypothetical protein